MGRVIPVQIVFLVYIRRLSLAMYHCLIINSSFLFVYIYVETVESHLPLSSYLARHTACWTINILLLLFCLLRS